VPSYGKLYGNVTKSKSSAALPAVRLTSHAACVNSARRRPMNTLKLPRRVRVSATSSWRWMRPSAWKVYVVVPRSAVRRRRASDPSHASWYRTSAGPCSSSVSVAARVLVSLL
jgi:hypothetical protein